MSDLRHFRCASCGGINRLPAARLAANPTSFSASSPPTSRGERHQGSLLWVSPWHDPAQCVPFHVMLATWNCSVG